MTGVRRIAIPPVPGSFPPEQRAFLNALRSGLLAAEGQTDVARREDGTNLAKREMRALLPGMVDLLIRDGVQSTVLALIASKENVFVQDDEPNFRGQGGIWVQTGLPGDSFTIWIEDGTGASPRPNVYDLIPAIVADEFPALFAAAFPGAFDTEFAADFSGAFDTEFAADFPGAFDTEFTTAFPGALTGFLSSLAAALYIGGASDRLKIDTDGTVRLEGAAQAWTDMTAELIGRRLYSAVGKVDYDYEEQTVVFQPGGDIAVIDDRVQITWQMGHDAAAGVSLFPHIHWEQPDATERVFTWQYRVQNAGQPKNTTWTQVVTSTATAGVNAFPYVSGTLDQVSKLGEIPLAGAGLSARVQFRLVRSDSNTGNISASFIDAHYRRDGFGSAQEYVK